jgi:CDGSH-type Zn-finger protein
MEHNPIEATLEANRKYCWCTCGLSMKEPFCDGTHKTADTDKRSLHFYVDEPKKAWLCTCKQTKNPPYCDGSHKK